MKWKQWAVEMSFLNHFQRWKITFVKNNLVRADKAEELLQKPADSYLYINIDYHCYQGEITTSASCLLYEGGGKVGKAE